MIILHILFTSSWFPNKKSPQNGDFVQRHAKAVSLNHLVTFIHVECLEGIQQKEIVTTKEGNYTEIIAYIPNSKIRPFNFIHKFRQYNILAKQVAPYDLIHTNIISFHTLWVYCRYLFHQEQYVITEHWTRYSERDVPISYLECKLFALFAKAAKYIFPVSSDLKNGMISLGLNSKFAIIPNVVNTDLFSLKNKGDNKSIQFLHVSSLENEHKNIVGMLQVILRLSQKYPFEFLIIGAEKQYVRDFITQNQLSETVKLIQNVPNQQIATYMKQADCFVLFSNYENQPCVISEAFSTGLPVIATNVGGIAEFFPNNFGILVEKGNENQLYAAMEKVINGHTFEAASTIRNYAQATFSYEQISNTLSHYYHQIFGK